MAVPGLAPRRAAVRLLDGVLGRKRQLSELTAEGAGVLDGLDPQDRARAQRLALTTLRHLEQADRLLRPYLRKLPPLSVENTLRLGVVEIAVLNAAPHGVVSTAVDLVRTQRKLGHLSGLVNAVLRRAGAEAAARWPDLPAPGLPKWLRGRLVASLGEKAVYAIEAAHAAGARMDLTFRTSPGPDQLAAIGATALPTGSVRLGTNAQISQLDGFAEGAFWVQDAAAAVPARLLAPRSGERVLDLCAAPGGKTMQLAAAGAHVTALDISDSRMARLRENLARTGLSVTCVVADAFDWDATASFDAILLDAPCSATGTIRRHPDLPHIRDGSDLETLASLQARLIDRAVSWLAPGGRLVYATCSLLPEEGEDQARAALGRHASLTADVSALRLPGLDPAWMSETGLRLRPDYWAELGGMDGFFVAAFRKS